MRATRFAYRLARLFPLLAFPVRAAAQTAGADSSGATPAPSSWGGSVAILAVVLLMLLAIGVAVKLFDRKRKREEAALSLQSLSSDPLLPDPSLARLPITAVADRSLWGRSPVVVAITGTVPTPEQREAVMRLVTQGMSRPHPLPRGEGRLVGAPRMQGRSAPARLFGAV